VHQPVLVDAAAMDGMINVLPGGVSGCLEHGGKSVPIIIGAIEVDFGR